MKKSQIITVPNLDLRQKTDRIKAYSPAIAAQINDMVEVLRHEGGIGLAANQLGYNNQLVVVEFNDPEKKHDIPLTIFINPEIVDYSTDKECYDEGCLSVPKLEFEIERPTALKIKYEDIHGRKIKVAPKGLLARILQHEVDHLNGILFIDHAREQLQKKYPSIKKTGVVFFGTGEFAAVILEGLIHLGLKIKIFTEPARPAGRQQKTTQTPVARVALKFNQKYQEVTDLKALAGDMSATDLLVCADFGHKIPENILDKVKAAINLHGSLLPHYQGPSPIQTAILNGEKETGVSIIEMTNEIDKGPVLSQISTKISADDDYLTLRDRLAILGLKLLAIKLPAIVSGQIEKTPQEGKFASFTRKFTKTDGQIDWQRSPEEIDRQVRALHPWPGTYTYFDLLRLKIIAAHLEDGKLALDLVQPEGGTQMPYTAFLRGWKGKLPTWHEKIKI